jgi:phosphinothricin acetyltransferase
MSNFTIRPALIGDLPKLTVIYNQAILAKQNANTQPFKVSERKAWFEAHQNPKYPLLIVEDKGALMGFATLSSYRSGRQALRYAVEVSYYVDKDHQRKGVGTILLKKMEEVAENLGYKHLFAILLDNNLPSVRLLEKFGFVKWGHLPNIVEIDEKVHGHLYYGKHLKNATVAT